jgi:DNA-binding beta-propeller fold protein YncE
MKLKGFLLLISLVGVMTISSTLFLNLAKADSLIGTISLRDGMKWADFHHELGDTCSTYKPLLAYNDLTASTLGSPGIVYLLVNTHVIDDFTNTEYQIRGDEKWANVGLIFNPFNKNLYVITINGVDIIDANPLSPNFNRLLKHIDVNYRISSIGKVCHITNPIVDPTNGDVYFAQYERLFIINGHFPYDMLVTTSDVNNLREIILNPYNGFIYGHNTKDVYVIDKRGGFQARIPIDNPPRDPYDYSRLSGMAVDPAGNVYVGRWGSTDWDLNYNRPMEWTETGILYCKPGYVYKIGPAVSDPIQVSQPIKVGPCPEDLLFDNDNGRLYVANGNGTTGNRETQRLDVVYPNGEKRSAFYAACGEGSVSVVDTQRELEIDTIRVGYCPGSIFYDYGNGNIYVYNHGIHSDPQQDFCWENPPGEMQCIYRGSFQLGVPADVSVISTVTPFTSSLETSIKDHVTGNNISPDSSVPYGTVTHANAKLNIKWKPETVRDYMPVAPTGSIVVTRYLEKGCQGPSGFEVVDIDDRIRPDSSIPFVRSYTSPDTEIPFALSFVGGASYLTTYSGDENYDPVPGTCVSVSIRNPEVTTKIIAKGTDVTDGIVSIGTEVRDTAKIFGGPDSPPNTIPFGEITYYLYPNSKCAEDPIRRETFQISDGIVSKSDPFTIPPGLDGISYKAYYNNIIDGGCESSYVGHVLISILNEADRDVTNNQGLPPGSTVRAKVTALSDQNILNSVVLRFFKNANCAGEPDDIDPLLLVDNRDAESDTYTLGTGSMISYKANFGYNVESDCVFVTS